MPQIYFFFYYSFVFFLNIFQIRSFSLFLLAIFFGFNLLTLSS